MEDMMRRRRGSVREHRALYIVLSDRWWPIKRFRRLFRAGIGKRARIMPPPLGAARGRGQHHAWGESQTCLGQVTPPKK